MKRALLLILVIAVMLPGCSGPAYTPESTLSPRDRGEIVNNLLTKEIGNIKFKNEFADKFDNQDVAEYVHSGFKSCVMWVKKVNSSIYTDSEDTTRLKFGDPIIYEIFQEEYNLDNIYNALKGYRLDSKYEESANINGFERYLIDLMESAAWDIWGVGKYSNELVYYEELIKDREGKNEELGVNVKLLDKTEQENYDLAKSMLGYSIDYSKETVAELANYFDIDWE